MGRKRKGNLLMDYEPPITVITNEQKKEIRQFIEAQATQFTDFASMLYEVLELSPKITPNNLRDLSIRGQNE